MNRLFISHLPSHDGQRGAVIRWTHNCQQSFDQGVTCAQAWLSNDDTGWLWANLIVERDALPPRGTAPRVRGRFSLPGAPAFVLTVRRWSPSPADLFAALNGGGDICRSRPAGIEPSLTVKPRICAL